MSFAEKKKGKIRVASGKIFQRERLAPCMEIPDWPVSQYGSRQDEPCTPVTIEWRSNPSLHQERRKLLGRYWLLIRGG